MSNAVQRMGLEAWDSQAQGGRAGGSSMTLPNSTGMHCDSLKWRTSTKTPSLANTEKKQNTIEPKGLRKSTIQKREKKKTRV